MWQKRYAYPPNSHHRFETHTRAMASGLLHHLSVCATGPAVSRAGSRTFGVSDMGLFNIRPPDGQDHVRDDEYLHNGLLERQSLGYQVVDRMTKLVRECTVYHLLEDHRSVLISQDVRRIMHPYNPLSDTTCL